MRALRRIRICGASSRRAVVTGSGSGKPQVGAGEKSSLLSRHRAPRSWRRRRAGRTHVQKSVTPSRADAPGRPPLVVQPRRQRVRPQVLVHHQHGPSIGRESAEPESQHRMQDILADLDRRVAPEQIDSRIVATTAIGKPVGSDHANVAQAEGLGIVFREFARPFVHVDGPHRGAGRSACHRQCDGSGAAPQVHQVSRRRRRRGVGEKDLGPGIEATVREDRRVGVVGERVVGEQHVDATT